MISSETVTKIKAYIEQGQRVGEIASAYDVSRQTISKIASGRTHTAVQPARSVPQLSKEAERVKVEKRLAEAAGRRLQESEGRQLEAAELKRQADRKIWEAEERQREAEESQRKAERQLKELERQVAKSTPQPAPAAHEPAEPEHAPAAAPPLSLVGVQLDEILSMLDSGQLPHDSLPELIRDMPVEHRSRLRRIASDKAGYMPGTPTQLQAKNVVTACDDVMSYREYRPVATH